MTMGAGGKTSFTRHYACNESICQTVSIDFDAHMVWFTVVVKGLTVNRIGMSTTQFKSIIDFMVSLMSANDTKAA